MFDLILTAGLAVFISASCSIAEAVLYSVPWSAVENLRREGRNSGALLFKLRTDIEKPITAILTLNTIANTAGASIAGAAAVKVFGSQVMGVFAALFTLAILIFSEILPKTIGVAYARTLAPYLAWPLTILIRVFTPLIWVISSIARILAPKAGKPQTTEDDIRSIVSLTRQSGILKPYEELSIKNILTLDLKMVQDIMTPRIVVFSLPAEMTVLEARKQDHFWQHSRIPVYENEDTEDIVGVVYRRHILEALANDQDDTTMSRIMRPAVFVLETLTLDKLLVQFLESRTHLLVVLDEYGGIAGVVTLEDVVEEILGKEIMDETDQVADMRELARRRRKSLTKAP